MGEWGKKSERWEGKREKGGAGEKDNQQAGATKAGIHDLISQFIIGRGGNERPTGGLKYR